MEYNSYFCPICGRAYARNPGDCECGFRGIEYKYNPDELTFRIYKYAKEIFFGKREFEKSELFSCEIGGIDMIDGFAGKRGVEYIEAPSERESYVTYGVAALERNTKALIINADTVDSDFLDESSVTSVFFGKRFSRISDGYFKKNGLKYITVHPDNEHFSSDGNVLFNKSKSILICYPPKRTEEEYRAPESVMVVEKLAFRYACNLKRIYLPKTVYLEKDAVYPEGSIEILYY